MLEKDRNSQRNEVGENEEKEDEKDIEEDPKTERDKILGILRESVIKSPRRNEEDKETD